MLNKKCDLTTPVEMCYMCYYGNCSSKYVSLLVIGQWDSDRGVWIQTKTATYVEWELHVLYQFALRQVCLDTFTLWPSSNTCVTCCIHGVREATVTSSVKVVD